MPHSYEDRILRVLDHIHANPAGDLSLDALSDVAAMSRFHWHRVFHGMTGETCAQAVRRVRLHRAACYLVQSDTSIAQIASLCGYPSVQSFTRAFRQGFGDTPGQFRNRGELRPLRHLKSKEDRPVYDVEVTQDPGHRLAALPHQGPYLEVGGAFEKVQGIATARELWPHAKGMIGLYYDDPNAVKEADLRSHAGLALSDDATIDAPLEEIRMDATEIARLRFKGPYAGLKAAYDYLYGVWLPESGKEPADAPVFEVYLNSPHDTAPDDLLTDICLPLKAA